MIRIAALALLAAPAIWAQSPPAFEVASIKHDPWQGSSGRVGVFVKNDTLMAEHTCLYGLVEFAYNLKDEHLSGGPAWAKCGLLATSDLYQVIAKASGDPPPPMDQFRLMLQTLLADRFQLQIHHVQKDLPIFNLVVAARGAKLKESAGDAKMSLHVDARVNGGKSVRITAVHVSMDGVLGQFEGYAKRPLFDHTGLTGFYDFVLEWDWDDNSPGVPSGDLVGQTFVGALEKQLGLKLESGTGPFDTVVIDRAEKPSEN